MAAAAASSARAHPHGQAVQREDDGDSKIKEYAAHRRTRRARWRRREHYGTFRLTDRQNYLSRPISTSLLPLGGGFTPGASSLESRSTHSGRASFACAGASVCLAVLLVRLPSDALTMVYIVKHNNNPVYPKASNLVMVSPIITADTMTSPPLRAHRQRF